MPEVRDPWRWRPLTGIPPDAHEWLAPEYEALAAEWGGLKGRLATDTRAAAFVGERLLKRQREFAVETGAIERLYHLRRGVTQHLVAEGLHTAVAGHTVEGVRTETLRGLLADQEAALERVYRDTAADADVSPGMLKAWHALLVQHQETVTEGREDYFDALQRADAGDLRSFSRYIALQASAAQLAANTAAQNALAGRMDDPPPNGGRTVGETYHEPP